MFANVNLSVRTASIEDRQKLANLVHFELYVHRHLDWRPPLDWLGYQPYLIAEKKQRVVAALACPPDPPNVAWIRLFAVSSDTSLALAWRTLWQAARTALSEDERVDHVAAIPMQNWFRSLLHEAGFHQLHSVVMLRADPSGKQFDERLPPGAIIRPMNLDDLAQVEKIDQASFGSVWKNSQLSLELAFRQAVVATVLELDEGLVGYQISTGTSMGGHLARLAVLPAYQGRGLGYALVQDMLLQFKRRGTQSVTVNTQQDNQVSLSLYQKAGFNRTGEEYPVFEFRLHPELAGEGNDPF